MARFLGGLRQQIQHTFSLFNPLTMAEAHQQALIVEAQTKANFSSWSSDRPSCTQPVVTSPSLMPSETAKPKIELVTVPKESQCIARLCCFSCNKTGHKQLNCPTRNRRGLLLDASGRDVVLEQEEELPDLEESCELQSDNGHVLMLR